jgi:hypothetical protein
VTQDSFKDRLARIADANGTDIASDRSGRPRAPQSKKATRLERALEMAQRAGISRNMAYPPLFGRLAALGLPVRPVPYLSPATLFSLGFVIGTLIFGGIHLFFQSPEAADPTLEATPGLINLNWPGVFVMALLTGAAVAAFVRFQAAHAKLPAWEDI